MWTISTPKIGTASIFPLAGCVVFGRLLFVRFVDAVFRNDFARKNYTPYSIIGNILGD